MPAAAKIEKPTAPGELNNGKGKMTSNKNKEQAAEVNSSNNVLQQDPPKIVNTIIEKKIRNLEKRKVNVLLFLFYIL